MRDNTTGFMDIIHTEISELSVSSGDKGPRLASTVSPAAIWAVRMMIRQRRIVIVNERCIPWVGTVLYTQCLT